MGTSASQFLTLFQEREQATGWEDRGIICNVGENEQS